MDKHSDVYMVGFRETWRILTEKCVLEVEGLETKVVCGIEHICGGTEAGIEGGKNSMLLLWQQNL